jgi:hypothetical protein
LIKNDVRRSKYYYANIILPWSTKDYLIVFSGATADTETVYTLGINVFSDTNFKNLLDLGNYEPNNNENQSTPINTTETIMSYLHKNDVDFYTVNLNNASPEYKRFVIDYCDADYWSVTTRYLSFYIRSTTKFVKGTDVSLSTSSPYINISDSMRRIDDTDKELYEIQISYRIINDIAHGMEIPITITIKEPSGISSSETVMVTIPKE